MGPKARSPGMQRWETNLGATLGSSLRAVTPSAAPKSHLPEEVSLSRGSVSFQRKKLLGNGLWSMLSLEHCAGDSRSAQLKPLYGVCEEQCDDNQCENDPFPDNSLALVSSLLWIQAEIPQTRLLVLGFFPIQACRAAQRARKGERLLQAPCLESRNCHGLENTSHPSARPTVTPALPTKQFLPSASQRQRRETCQEMWEDSLCQGSPQLSEFSFARGPKRKK